MSRGALVRLLLVLGLLGGCAALALTQEPRLGLDLRGGTQIVLETQDSPTRQGRRRGHRPRPRGAAPPRRRARRRRADPDPLRRAPHHRRAARRAGPARGRRGHRPTAQLTFHPVARDSLPTTEAANAGTGAPGRSCPTRPAQTPRGSARPRSTGEGVDRRRRRARPAAGRRLVRHRRLHRQRLRRLAASSPATAACAQPGRPERRVAIVLDDEVISSPAGRSDVPCDVGIAGGTTQITGAFTRPAGQGPRPADRGRRAARARRGHRAAHRRRRRSARPPSRPAPRPASSAVLLTGAVHRRRLPAASACSRRSRSPATPCISYAALRRPRRHADPARAWPASCSPSAWRSTRTCWSSSEPRRSTPRHRASGLRRRADRPASTRRGARSSTPTSPRCWPPGCCSSWPPAGQGLRRHARRSASSPRWSPRWSSPACSTDFGVCRDGSTRRPAVTRLGAHRPGPRPG